MTDLVPTLTIYCPRCGQPTVATEPDLIAEDPYTWHCPLCNREVQFSRSGKKTAAPRKTKRQRSRLRLVK